MFFIKGGFLCRQDFWARFACWGVSAPKNTMPIFGTFFSDVIRKNVSCDWPVWVTWGNPARARARM